MAKRAESTISQSGKRHCGEYTLLMHTAPAAFTLAQLEELFAPIAIKRCEEPGAGEIKTVRKVNFLTEEDAEKAMKEKQWQYIGKFCIRLSSLEDQSMMEKSKSWKSVNRDLQLDIFAYFDVHFRGRFRRVSKEWNTVLEPSWDGQVNKCFYFDFNAVHRMGKRLLTKVQKSLMRVNEDSKNQCGKVTRLILKYPTGTKSPDADLCFVEYMFGWFEKACPTPRLLDAFLLQHHHINTVILLGFTIHEEEFQRGHFQLGTRMRAPWPLKVTFHDSHLQLMHYFPRKNNDENKRYDGDVFEGDELCGWRTRVPLEKFSLDVDFDLKAKDRHVQLHREMDKRKTLWPWPGDKMQKWLQPWLKTCTDCMENDKKQIADCNKSGQLSLRQAIKKYLTKDVTKKAVGRWEATGVFFEKAELAWRDCFFLANLEDKWDLLSGGNGPRQPYGMQYFQLKKIGPVEGEKFKDKRQVDKFVLKEDGVGHNTLEKRGQWSFDYSLKEDDDGGKKSDEDESEKGEDEYEADMGEEDGEE